MPKHKKVNMHFSSNGHLKKYHRFYKLIGSILILISFITQITLYNYWDTKVKQHEFALFGYSAAFITSLEYQNLYFTSAIATEVVNNDLIFGAAREDAIGRSMMIIASDLSKEDKLKRVNDVIFLSRKVNDLDSWKVYLGSAEKLDVNNDQEKSYRFIEKINDSKKFSLFIYAILYILGSILLVIGSWFEKDIQKLGTV